MSGKRISIGKTVQAIIRLERIEQAIYWFRGHKIMLDTDMAALYDIGVSRLNEAVKRNLGRFPDDFMFILTSEESNSLQSQFAIAKGRGGRRTQPYAFTQEGVAMRSSVLRSPRAVAVNIQIMRASVRLRQLLAGHAELARKVAELENKYDRQFKVVFDAIRQLMIPPDIPAKPPIGFATEQSKSKSSPRESRRLSRRI
jgi:hypothetical protein